MLIESTSATGVLVVKAWGLSIDKLWKQSGAHKKIEG
jgi:hypothetical protein